MADGSLSYSMNDDVIDPRAAGRSDIAQKAADQVKTFRVTVADKPVMLETSAEQLPQWVIAAVSEFDRIGRYRDGWDSYKAKAVNWRTLLHALELFLKVMDDETPLPRIEATSGGGVEFLWGSDGKELEVEVEKPYRVSLYYLDPEGNVEREEPIGIEWQRLKDFLREFQR